MHDNAAKGAPFTQVPSGTAIAHYFWEKTDQRNNGCAGIDLYRDGADYCYLWVESMIDHDMWVSYLLDIRTCTGNPDDRFRETRDYLFVHAGIGNTFEVEWHQQPIRFDAPTGAHYDRTRDGLHWFVNRSLEAVERAHETHPVPPAERDGDE